MQFLFSFCALDYRFFTNFASGVIKPDLIVHIIITEQQKSTTKLMKKNEIKIRHNPTFSVPPPSKMAMEDCLVFARTKVYCLIFS